MTQDRQPSNTEPIPLQESIIRAQPRLIDPSPVKILQMGNCKVRIYRFTRTFSHQEKKYDTPFRNVVYTAFELTEKFNINLLPFDESESFCKEVIRLLKENHEIFSSAIYFPSAEFLIDPTVSVDGICVYNQSEIGHSYHRYKFKHMRLAGYIGILSEK